MIPQGYRRDYCSFWLMRWQGGAFVIVIRTRITNQEPALEERQSRGTPIRAR
jgi:hypothetical protein